MPAESRKRPNPKSKWVSKDKGVICDILIWLALPRVSLHGFTGFHQKLNIPSVCLTSDENQSLVHENLGLAIRIRFEKLNTAAIIIKARDLRA